MIRRCMAAWLTIALVAVSAQSIRAEVKTDQKTLVKFEGMLGRVVGLFGGKAAREGVKTSIAVKGDRKVSLTDQAGQIVDLREEKIYDLDIRKKTYRVTTFAELRRQMEEARKKAAEDLKKAQAEAKSAPTAPAPDSTDGKQMDVDFDLKETGQKKNVNGFDSRQIIMTITMREKGKTLQQSGGIVLTSDIWMTPAIKAMNEVVDFDVRYAKALAGPMIAGASANEMAAALAAYPLMQDAIARMRAENVKLDGTAVQTTTTIDAVKSEEQIAAEKEQQQGSQPAAGGSGSSAGVGGLLGGLGRRMANRGNTPPAAASDRATFMTMTNEVLSVSTTVADADVAVPAGFKEGR